MPAVPKRKAATRARENISNQYTAPFGPKPGQKRKLVNTATRYEKEDEAFEPEGYLHRTLGVQYPEAFDADPPRTRGSGAGAQVPAGRAKGGGRKGKARQLSTSSDVPFDQFLTNIGDTEVVPERTAIGVGAGSLKEVKRERTTSHTIDDGAAATLPATSHKRKPPPTASTPILPAILPPDLLVLVKPDLQSEQKLRFWQFAEPTSPLTPRSSNGSDADAEGEVDETFLSAPASPALDPVPDIPSLTAVDPALIIRSTTPQQNPPGPSSERWWTDIFPQPPSSPLSEPRSCSAANSTQVIRDRLTVPPVPPGGRLQRGSSDSLSSIRFSPRSDVSPDGDANQTSGAGPSGIVNDLPQRDAGAPAYQPVSPSLASRPPLAPAPIMTSSFRPRSQAFHRFCPIPEIPAGVSQPKAKEENEPPEELTEAWESLKVAYKWMERAMAVHRAKSQ